MPSPFPGMDPFLEGPDWEDFHQGFISELAASLVEQLRPRYVVRKEKRVYVEHEYDDEHRPIRADLALAVADDEMFSSRAEAGQAGEPVVLTLPMPLEMGETYLTVRRGDDLRIVTVIEVLSPTNKRPGADGFEEYKSNREEILASDTHLVELDLLRGGRRLPTVEALPRGDYYAFVRRSEKKHKVSVFAWSLRSPLPGIPIPLERGDADAVVNLQTVFTETYDRSGYDYSLDYQRALTPPLEAADREWSIVLVGSRKK